MTLGIGIDTGGTYTDAVVYDFEKKKVIEKAKTLTTKEDLSLGIGNALDELTIELVKKVEILSLSTTLATNACVEKKGGQAKLILLGTKRKVLEWIDAKTTYGLKNEDVFCLETNKNTDDNTIVHPNWDTIIKLEDRWFKEAQALAVAGISALENGAVCEKKAKKKLTAKYSVPFVMANELATGLNVLERGATALLNAKLLPIIEEFMEAVKKALKDRGLNIKEMIVRSDGSLMSDEMAVSHPVKTILSGPAASIIGGRGLINCENGLIVDMGGTTTDVSIIKNNEPVMTEGIRIGGFRTQIKGVFIDTFGLGGDSRIMFENNKLILGERRVEPLCVGAKKWPQIKKDLEMLLESKKVSTMPLYEFLYLVKKPISLKNYNSYEIDLINKLKTKPLMLGSGELDLYNLKSERLEDEGIVMRCGLTPTDIMHIKDDFSKNDKDSSVLAVKYLIKALPLYENSNEDFNRFCDDVYELVYKKLYENIVRIMLTNKHPELFEKGLNDQLKKLISQSWYEQGETNFFGMDFITNAILIGIGAPTHVFLPAVAKALRTKCVIPKHAEVANAFGAIIADVSAEAKIKISPNYSTSGITGYTVFSVNGSRIFDTLEKATQFAKETAKETAISDAKKRGALGELNITTKVNPNLAYAKEGDKIDLGTTVVASVTGRV